MGARCARKVHCKRMRRGSVRSVLATTRAVRSSQHHSEVVCELFLRHMVVMASGRQRQRGAKTRLQHVTYLTVNLRVRSCKLVVVFQFVVLCSVHSLILTVFITPTWSRRQYQSHIARSQSKLSAVHAALVLPVLHSLQCYCRRLAGLQTVWLTSAQQQHKRRCR